ncbi:MAG: aspartate-semialdehyde dehydrogenase [Legionellales bacterium]|nr:aspartate-semialdehyde dehydrogenase [Legionellales bacterium]|tara:strand:- start:7719 stop:8744 length:1026 start_codon:yes stop_codon:yes gene_type:complete
MTRESVNVAVLGATGAVGETLLTVLKERNVPIGTLYPLASARSAGKTVTFKGQTLTVLDVAQFDFAKADIGLFSAGGSVSADYAPKAAQAGCVVIDNTSQFRYEKGIPLVVPEVNPEAISGYKTRNIIANPNCSTIQMLVALKPIYDAVGIERINVATYQAVSGAGKSAIEALLQQTEALLKGQEPELNVFSQQIAFNVIPQIDNFQANGYTREEMKMVWETQKILADDRIKVNPTAVRVPVLYGHSEAISLETSRKITVDEARTILSKANGIRVLDDVSQALYPLPAREGTGHDTVFVGRIREDISHPNGLNLWVVADNIRKGAATNAVQIVEILLAKYL